MARIWLACAALLGLAFVALLALSAHGPQLLAALFDIRVPDLAGPPPAAAGNKGGSALATLAPAAGAGSSGLRLNAFEQALVVHGFHAIALAVAALWIALRGGLFANLAALGFLAGTLLFSGGIYARALGEPVDPGLTPLGGTILLGAWAVFALAALFGGAAAGAPAASRPATRAAPAAPPARPVTRAATAAPPARPASAATVFTGWASATPATARATPPAQQAARPLQVEARHQHGGSARPAVEGPPKRPAVSR
jgi:uncharacterized membrane protein YgdD (TMEM256/DUF423 family)